MTCAFAMISVVSCTCAKNQIWWWVSTVDVYCTQTLKLLWSSNKSTTTTFSCTTEIQHNINLHCPLQTQGEITIDGSFDGGMSLRTRAHPEAKGYGSLGGYTGAFPPQMETFLRAIVEGTTEEIKANPMQALQEVLVAKAIYKSVTTKHWEAVNVENVIEFDSIK